MAEKSNPNLSTSTRDSTGSLDLSGDADMKMAKKVITALTTDIVAIIQHEIAAEAATSKECDSDAFSSHLLMSTSTLPAAGAVFDSPLPQDVAPYTSQQVQSSEKIEFVTGNIVAQQRNSEANESGSSNIRKFSAQAGYDDISESVKHPEGGATEERAADHAISPVPSVMPYSFYQQAETMIKKEKSKAKTFMQKSADALRQVNADLDFAPDFNSEVQDTSNNYQKYMIGVKKKEAEMEELKDTYEKNLEKLKAKYKEKIRNKHERAEKMGNEIEEVKCEYEKSMKKLLEEIKQLTDQGNIRDSNFKIQTMTMIVEYSKEVAKLKDETFELTDVIAKLRDELNQNKLKEKYREIRILRSSLQHIDIKSAYSARKRPMEATAELFRPLTPFLEGTP